MSQSTPSEHDTLDRLAKIHASQCVTELTEKIAERGFRAGWEACIKDIKAFSVYGTDECQNCGDGRITLFIKHSRCIACAPHEYQSLPEGQQTVLK
jgi:hypothetical protein